MSFVTKSVDESRALVAEYFYAVAMDLRGPAETFTFDLDVLRLGPVTLAEVRFGAEVAVEVEQITTYHMDLPLAGFAETVQAGRAVTATPERAGLYRPDAGAILAPRISGDCRLLSVKMEPAGLETELESLLGHPVRGPLRLSRSLDLTGGPGRSLYRLVRLAGAELHDEGGLIFHPMVAGRLWHGILTGLLLAADHPYREELASQATPSRPRHVKRAIDVMEADPGRPVTVHDLARISGVGVRALQEGFHRHVGVSPMAYLRRLRLARAHEELRVASRGEATVASVASRWGFVHPGRFAAAYRRTYGVLPAETLDL
ncbi:AraC family transcriptional regulator [Phytohabitans sp. ZYX-F-186]|uniref:AraC family transcriptional regulator n=1 Tax=Phytohabitans maris TaxID=3071409 RepID=A0ABU0ZUP4_9ACTN|nr:AraC family transcriptional regulator [Phytohabitans sp. ZYX-F-186]MDQ7910707.1 AraC family transcriptional regulator [Phytohabitans sp. ZYX-F-186]